MKAPHLVFELRMGCLLLLVNALQETQGGALTGFEAYRQLARLSLLRGLLYFPLVMGGVLLFGVRGAIGANVAVAVIGCLLSSAAIRTQCRKMNIVVSMRGITSELSVIRRFTIPAVLSGVMVTPVIWLVNTILVNQPGGYGEPGLLSAANQWRTFLMFLPQAFLQVALPMMASEPTNSQTAARQYGKTFSLTRSLTLLAVVPPAVVLMLISSWIMKLYGLQFAAGVSNSDSGWHDDRFDHRSWTSCGFSLSASRPIRNGARTRCTCQGRHYFRCIAVNSGTEPPCSWGVTNGPNRGLKRSASGCHEQL